MVTVDRSHRDGSVENNAAKEGRQSAVREYFAGQAVAPQDVQRFYRTQGWEVSRQTVHRDLRDLEQAGSVSRAWGRISFPAVEEQGGVAQCDM